MSKDNVLDFTEGFEAVMISGGINRAGNVELKLQSKDKTQDLLVLRMPNDMAMNISTMLSELAVKAASMDLINTLAAKGAKVYFVDEHGLHELGDDDCPCEKCRARRDRESAARTMHPSSATQH